jgi:hypothetical protein
MADQVPTSVRSLVDKMLDPEMQEQIAHRAREFVASMGDAAEVASAKAGEAWRDSEPMRREAVTQANKVGRDALRWSRRTWRDDLRPGINRVWKNRMAALAAAGAAAPAAAKAVAEAANTGSVKERRHWGTFFFGLLLGAAAGAIAAMLTAPKAGRQMRDDLAVTARDAAVKAREAANRAKEAAANAGDWVPIFQRSSYEEPAAEAEAAPVEAPAARRAARRLPIEVPAPEVEPAN